MHRCSKFRQIVSIRYAVIVIFFSIFKDGGCRHLGFLKLLIFIGRIGQTIFEISRFFFIFSRWCPPFITWRGLEAEMHHHAKFH